MKSNKYYTRKWPNPADALREFSRLHRNPQPDLPDDRVMGDTRFPDTTPAAKP